MDSDINHYKYRIYSSSLPAFAKRCCIWCFQWQSAFAFPSREGSWSPWIESSNSWSQSNCMHTAVAQQLKAVSYRHNSQKTTTKEHTEVYAVLEAVHYGSEQWGKPDSCRRTDGGRGYETAEQRTVVHHVNVRRVTFDQNQLLLFPQVCRSPNFLCRLWKFSIRAFRTSAG